MKRSTRAKSSNSACADMLGLKAHADEARGEVLKAGDAGEDSQGERRLHGRGVSENAVEDAVGENLEALCVVDRSLAVALHLGEVVRCEGVRLQRLGENVGRGDSVL